MFLSRRQFLKVTAGTVAAVAVADNVLALTALQPVIEVGNPLGDYPDRSWERVYHDQYRYDSSFTWVCSPNDTHACRVRAFVRNGVVMRVEQNYDHQTYEDLYGNRGTFAHNPRMCLKGFTFQAHARVMGKGPAVAIEVFIGLVVVILFDPHHDAVADEGPDAAGMRVIRRTDPGKGGVVAVLVVIDPLPGPIRVVSQWVPDFDDRLERGQGQDLVRDGHCGDRSH